MKRIRTLLVMGLIICLSVGSFYIYAAAATNGYPSFYIKKEAGDEGVIRSLTLTGSLSARGVSEPVTISATGSQYNKDLSFMQRFNSLFSNHDGLEAYRDKYRSFMRGKHNTASFYEDSASLVFAGVNREQRHFSFTISQLNRENKDQSSFEVKVPDAAGYTYMAVADVQKQAGVLNVITINSVSGDSSSRTEVHCYRFDLKNKKLLGDQMIFSTPDVENNTSSRIINLTAVSEMAPEDYYVFFKDSQTMSPPNEKGESTEEAHKREMYAYQFATKTVHEIPFPKEVNEQAIMDSMSNYYHGPLIYFATPDSDAKGIKVVTYNIEAKKAVGQYSIPVEEMGAKADAPIQIKNNRIYLLVINHDQTGNVDVRTNYVVVADLKTGEVLYKGKVIPKPDKGSNSQRAGSLYINAMNLN